MRHARSAAAPWAVVVISVLLTGCARSDVESAVPARNKALVRAAFDRWKAGTGSPFELLRPTAEWTIVGSSPLSKTYTSKQQFIDEVIAPFNARMTSPLVPEVRGLYADGDVVVVFFDGESKVKDGQPYRNTYTWYIHLQADTIVKVVAFFDTRRFDELWTRVPG